MVDGMGVGVVRLLVWWGWASCGGMCICWCAEVRVGGSACVSVGAGELGMGWGGLHVCLCGVDVELG